MVFLTKPDSLTTKHCHNQTSLFVIHCLFKLVARKTVFVILTWSETILFTLRNLTKTLIFAFVFSYMLIAGFLMTRLIVLYLKFDVFAAHIYIYILDHTFLIVLNIFGWHCSLLWKIPVYALV